MLPFFHWQGEDLILNCHLQPKASKDELVGIHNGRLKVRITAPPVDGKANAHLINYFAELFGVPRRNISILKGELGRQKTVCISAPKKIPSDLEEQMRNA